MANQRQVSQRGRSFNGCEGASKIGHVTILRKFAEEGRAVHVEGRILGKTGDPLSLVQRAISAAKQ